MSLSTLSLTSSDDDDGVQQARLHRQRMDPMQHYSDEEFIQRYRLSKQTILQLTDLIGDKLKPWTHRNHSISAVEQIMLTIRFYATGAFQITVSDNIRVHKSTACRIIKKVSSELAQLRPHFIKMPMSEESRADTKAGFYAIRQFPNVLGAVDCTHVKIQSPGGEQAELYRNRKGYFSLNVQAICNAKLEIMDVIARWPGSVHDTTILNDSHIRADFERGVYGQGYLLGDSGYPCRTYLLTPFLTPRTPSEQAYNTAQIATRNTVERCFGVLKRRFACLSMGLRTKLKTTMNCIVACCVLHNIAIQYGDTIEDPPNNDVELPAANAEVNRSNENTSVRSALLQTHFTQ